MSVSLFFTSYVEGVDTPKAHLSRLWYSDKPSLRSTKKHLRQPASWHHHHRNTVRLRGGWCVTIKLHLNLIRDICFGLQTCSTDVLEKVFIRFMRLKWRERDYSIYGIYWHVRTCPPTQWHHSGVAWKLPARGHTSNSKAPTQTSNCPKAPS